MRDEGPGSVLKVVELRVDGCLGHVFRLILLSQNTDIDAGVQAGSAGAFEQSGMTAACASLPLGAFHHCGMKGPGAEGGGVGKRRHMLLGSHPIQAH